MIDEKSITAWRKYAPWPELAQVEQDLIISRALVAIYNHPLLKKELAFRGGTALQKCFFESPTRYSEDIGLVQLIKGPVGDISNALHDTLNPWLGQPKVKRWAERLTFIYRFLDTESNNNMRLKVEINTSEGNSLLGLIQKPFAFESSWHSGETIITTYKIDELMSSKLRALYQRKKGRDLFDMARAIELLPIDINLILDCFKKHLERENIKISRAEFERNLSLKRNTPVFVQDIFPLLPVNAMHDFNADFDIVMGEIISRLAGEPWKGLKDKADA